MTPSMAERGSILDELPHYVLVLALAYVGLELAGRLAPGIQLWQEVALALLIALAYVAVVTRLGFAPDSWFPGRSSE